MEGIVKFCSKKDVLNERKKLRDCHIIVIVNDRYSLSFLYKCRQGYILTNKLFFYDVALERLFML